MTDLGFTHRWDPRPGSPHTLLLLHGTGGDENDLVPLGDLIDREANLLSPRGQVLEHGMPRFFRRLAEGVFDMDDLKARTQGLGDFVQAASAEYGFPTDGVTAVGFSNGANIAAALLLLRPGLVRQAVLLRAMVPLEPEPLPDLSGTRVFIAAGEQDPIIPPSNSQRLAELLQSAGADVTLHWSPVGHQLTRADVDASRAWLLAPADAPRTR
ncbi:MAG: alpha/beta hydrolase [Gemmatimonadaceae bacterium]|nr:alpha/beta hydrolase [Gemmatimonadaceae bacterium]MCW5826295.1 alpha/beta hydrolase [Gemmatimonadaceae bacterium]